MNIERLNPLDLFFLFLYLRIAYVAVFHGISREIYKAVSFFCTCILAINYYVFFATAISDKLLFLNEEYIYFVSFFFLIVGVGLVFLLLGKLAVPLMAGGDITGLERILALILGGGRFIFFSSVIIFFFYLSPLSRQHLDNSIVQQTFKNVAPRIYLVSSDILIKFNPKLMVNREVKKYYEIKKFLSRNNQEGD